MPKKSDTPKKPGPVFLVHFFLIPHRDSDRVNLVQVEVIVLVPLWVEGVFGSVCAVGLRSDLEMNSFDLCCCCNLMMRAHKRILNCTDE